MAVEFGIIAPLLILLIFGIIDFGWAFNRNTVVDNVARDAVRVASLSGSYADVKSTVDSELAAYGIDPTKVAYQISCRTPANSVCANTASSFDSTVTAGSSVKVTITYTHDLMTPLGAMCGLVAGESCVGNQIVLSKAAEMVRE